VSCYRVEAQAGPEGIRTLTRPDDVAPFTRKVLQVGDEFVARSIRGSPNDMQFVEMADGHGFVPWDCGNLRLRLSLSAKEFCEGQRVEARENLEYGSGDTVVRKTQGTIERLVPYIGVRWDGLDGIKAVRSPRRVLGDARQSHGTRVEQWRRRSPDTLIIAVTRDLCEQVADVARHLRDLLPEEVRSEWTVAVACGAPPGMGKKLKRGNEQWPFPAGNESPRVLVASLEFVSYFFRQRHVPLWAGIRYVVFDECDRYLSDKKSLKLLTRVKTMFLRAQREEGSEVQTVLVTSTLPSQGTRSPLVLASRWMPHALRALPRPDLLHCNHPMIEQRWVRVPGDGEDSFNERVRLLVEYLHDIVGTREGRGTPGGLVREKTIVFCNDHFVAARLAECLASVHKFESVGILVDKVRNDERRRRMRMFREGQIMVLVSTDLISRGIDVPDVKHVVQFDFSKNIINHIHRIGRASRGGSRGHALNFFDDSLKGGRALAEAVQEVGKAPLDGLFSRRGGFKKGLRRTEAFRQMLLMQGLPLPPHLQSGNMQDAPLLADAVLKDVEDGNEVGRLEDDANLRAFEELGGDASDAEVLKTMGAMKQSEVDGDDEDE